MTRSVYEKTIEFGVPSGVSELHRSASFDMCPSAQHGSLGRLPSLVCFVGSLTADVRSRTRSASSHPLVTHQCRARLKFGPHGVRGAGHHLRAAFAVLGHARNNERGSKFCEPPFQPMARSAPAVSEPSTRWLPNQALQTTPMTRSVYEKTIEFGRSQRGV